MLNQKKNKMKKNITIILLSLLPLLVIGQVPQAFNYQAVVRDAEGSILNDIEATFFIEILQDGTPVYSEMHTEDSGKTGVVNFKVGEGDDPSSDFAEIDWSQGQYQISVTLDGQSIGTADIVSVPMALYAQRSGNDFWDAENEDIYYNQGKVGIGVDAIDVGEGLNGTLQINSIRPIIIKNNGGNGVYGSEIGFNAFLKTAEVPNKFIKLGGTLQEGGAVQAVDKDGNMFFQMYDADTQDESIIDFKPDIAFRNNGDVDIGISNEVKFQVNSIRPIIMKNNGGQGVYGSEIGFNAMLNTGVSPNKFIKLGGTEQGGGAVQAVDHKGNMFFQMYDADTQDESIIDYNPSVVFRSNGRVGIGTLSPESALEVNGMTVTTCLKIIGGCDIKEDINAVELLEPGDVVVIDENNPGQIRRTEKEYDKKVAGVISGANGISPGLSLSQEDVLEGEYPLTMLGRVYVKVTGKVEIGDMLTTSSIPGYAMSVKDHANAHGTVIGKAMTANKDGEGMVLVLVNLQ
jgi:hypothetical protein